MSAQLEAVGASVSVARQPIFDQHRQLFAYELLFRDSLPVPASAISGDQATRSLLLNTYAEFGLSRVAGDHRIFVNFTAETLCAGLPRLFPPEQLVVEILEDVEPSTEVLEACRKLREEGYMCALDDFVYEERFEPLIDFAQIVKVDFLLSDVDEIRRLASDLDARGKLLLAEKVETAEQFELACEMGFKLFQGFFFSRPELMQTNTVRSLKIQLVEMLSAASGEDYDIGEIEQLLRADVATAYKLLRYINSAAMRTAREVTSIRHAVTLLGRREFRNFVALLLSADVGAGKPAELTRLSLVRARFCEEIAPVTVRRSEFFLLGLCSLFDAMLDQPMDQIVAQLPFPQYLCDALRMGHPFSDYLSLIRAHEQGDWPQVSRYAASLSLEENLVAESYMDALAWADSMTGSVAGD